MDIIFQSCKPLTVLCRKSGSMSLRLNPRLNTACDHSLFLLPTSQPGCNIYFGFSHCYNKSATGSNWQLVSATFILNQLLAATDSYCQPLSYSISYWQLLTASVSHCYTQSVTGSYWQLVSATVIINHLLTSSES